MCGRRVEFSIQLTDSERMATWRFIQAACLTTCVEISYGGVYEEPVRRRMKEWIVSTGRRKRQHLF
jgi:hypothetical protein